MTTFSARVAAIGLIVCTCSLHVASQYSEFSELGREQRIVLDDGRGPIDGDYGRGPIDGYYGRGPIEGDDGTGPIEGDDGRGPFDGDDERGPIEWITANDGREPSNWITADDGREPSQWSIPDYVVDGDTSEYYDRPYLPGGFEDPWKRQRSNNMFDSFNAALKSITSFMDWTMLKLKGVPNLHGKVDFDEGQKERMQAAGGLTKILIKSGLLTKEMFRDLKEVTWYNELTMTQNTKAGAKKIKDFLKKIHGVFKEFAASPTFLIDYPKFHLDELQKNIRKVLEEYKPSIHYKLKHNKKR